MSERPVHLDQLTRLADRSALLERLREELEAPGWTPGSTAILFVDLDGFRRVNRDRGHGVGDELLFAAARRLAAVASPGDLVARAGGDEFALMTCGLERGAEVAGLANRVLEAFDDPFELGLEAFTCTASIGVAVATDPGTPPEALLGEAEVALERVPSGTRRFELFDAELRERIRERAELGNDFAATLREGGLKLAYQPIVDIASGRIASVEALARWQHPTRGAVSPELFVAVAEETGRGADLLDAVLARAAADAAAITAADPSDRIAIAFNVSPSQLGSDVLVERVSMLVARSGIPAERFVVEISEAALSGGADLYLRRVSELRALGVRIALDDFGTASTSIAQLRSLPIDQIKLDRSFVTGLGESSADAALAAGLLPMARALGIEVVAEGIETDQQLAHLFALGYRLGQGYRFAVALPPGDVATLIATGPLPAVNLSDNEAEIDLRTRYQEALIAGDAKWAETVVGEAVATGIGAMTIQTEIIGRALHWVGSEWEAGRLGAADEHLASAICERQLTAVFEALHGPRPERPRSRRVLLAAIGGEGEGEGELKIAAEALDAAGYETVFLGRDVAAEALEAAAGTHRPRAVCLAPAAGAGEHLESALVRLSAVEEPPLVLVGGDGFELAMGSDDRAISISSPQDALDALAAELAA